MAFLKRKQLIMKTIETTAIVADDGTVTLRLPPEISPGPHRIVVVVGESVIERAKAWTISDFPVHNAALLDATFSMRREDLYSDDGR
jgi:hypothetical protein